FLVAFLGVILLVSLSWTTKLVSLFGLTAVFGQTIWVNSDRGDLVAWWAGLLGTTLLLSTIAGLVLRLRGWRFQRLDPTQQYDQPQLSILGLILLTTACAGLVSLVKFFSDLPLEWRWVSHFAIVPLGFCISLIWGMNIFLGKAPRWVYLPFFLILVPMWGLLVPVAFDRNESDYIFMVLWMAAHLFHIILSFCVLRSAGYRLLRKSPLKANPAKSNLAKSISSQPVVGLGVDLIGVE
ncbi:MAG: hypothetical protein ACI9G1_004321, partial [Pirellulaceae bacterium]